VWFDKSTLDCRVRIANFSAKKNSESQIARPHDSSQAQAGQIQKMGDQLKAQAPAPVKRANN